MANIFGKFETTILDTSGNAKQGATVTLRLEGGSVNGNQSSATSPHTFNMYGLGTLGAGDVVSVNAGSTTYNIDSVSNTTSPPTATISGFSGTLALNDGDRITVVTSASYPITSAKDSFNGLTQTLPLTTDSNGYASCFVVGGYYDYLVSGTGLTTTLYVDYYVSSPNAKVYVIDNSTLNQGLKIDTYGTLATAQLARFSNNGTSKWTLSPTGAVAQSAGLTVSSGGITITSGGLAVSSGNFSMTGNATITGGITVSGNASVAGLTANSLVSAGAITASSGDITSSLGDLIGRRALPNKGTALVTSDIALGAGWGNTASVSSVVGSDTAFTFTVAAGGSGLSASTATCTLTFKDGAYAKAPIVVAVRGDATAPTTGFASTGTVNTTTAVVQFQGLPVNGSSYIFWVHILGSR